MIIVNQDRDIAMVLESLEEQTLSTCPAWYDKKIWGIGIYLQDILLGTFDTINEAVKEIENIVFNFNEGFEKYLVYGHCKTTDYETELLKALFESEEL